MITSFEMEWIYVGKESDQDGKQWIFGPFILQLTLTYIIMGKKVSLFMPTLIFSKC